MAPNDFFKGLLVRARADSVDPARVLRGSRPMS